MYFKLDETHIQDIFSENIYVDIGTKMLLIILFSFVFFAVHDDKNQAKTLSQHCLFLSKIGRKKIIDISCYNINNVDGYTVKSDQLTI